MSTETIAKVSKMSIAKQIFAEVIASGSATPRKEFMTKFVEQGSATKNVASSYYQNLRDEAKGEKLYKHHLTPKQRAERNAAKTAAIARSE